MQVMEVSSKGNIGLFVRLQLGLGLGSVLATKNRYCIVHTYSVKIVYKPSTLIRNPHTHRIF